MKEGLKGHVVVEMSDLDNEPLVKLVGGELIETVVAHDVIGRLMIQCALQPGLAQVLSLIFLSFKLLFHYQCSNPDCSPVLLSMYPKKHTIFFFLMSLNFRSCEVFVTFYCCLVKV